MRKTNTSIIRAALLTQVPQLANPNAHAQLERIVAVIDSGIDKNPEVEAVWAAPVRSRQPFHARVWEMQGAGFGPLFSMAISEGDDVVAFVNAATVARMLEVIFGSDSMSRAEAIVFLTFNPARRVSFSTRDATGDHWLQVTCRLEDGDLVQPHPTDAGHWAIAAPQGVRFKPVATEATEASL